MSNKEIIKQLKLAASLLELNGANPFKVRAYTSTVFQLERLDEQLEGKSVEEMIALSISKGIAPKISALIAQGGYDELDDLIAQTPNGVVQMLDIKGIGVKKIKTIWQELGIDTLDKLLAACQAKEVSKLKGFGAKTEQLIIEQIEYMRANSGKLLYSKAEPLAATLAQHLKENLPSCDVSISGQVRRRMEIIDVIQLVVGTDEFDQVRGVLDDISDLSANARKSGPFVWRGVIVEHNMDVEVLFTPKERFHNTLFLNSAAPQHLAAMAGERKIKQIANAQSFSSEEAIYEALEMDFIQPEMREGDFELKLAREKNLPQLVEMEDLKGALHNHSTYSDGRHSLAQMAQKCIELGYEYLGISDHSQTAFYANGLTEERILEQHAEIDQLNEKLAPFKIFKGIESDILSDGSLDYPEDILKRFDFIVSSIHGNLKMDKEKATTRLLKAIENPYTTILGHPTGRLLLKREGYPIDHKAVIDACAKHGVSIEINANPMRLDLDWRWVRYALDQGIMIAINPDAHDKEHYTFMKYGLLVGRKAGLTKEMTLNALSKEALEAYFAQRKQGE
ncbi:MAG: DNA polymerase/3'-5' exonuclease PolX [Flammeovirgaceae bacterium]